MSKLTIVCVHVQYIDSFHHSLFTLITGKYFSQTHSNTEIDQFIKETNEIYKEWPIEIFYWRDTPTNSLPIFIRMVKDWEGSNIRGSNIKQFVAKYAEIFKLELNADIVTELI